MVRPGALLHTTTPRRRRDGSGTVSRCIKRPTHQPSHAKWEGRLKARWGFNKHYEYGFTIWPIAYSLRVRHHCPRALGPLVLHHRMGAAEALVRRQGNIGVYNEVYRVLGWAWDILTEPAAIHGAVGRVRPPAPVSECWRWRTMGWAGGHRPLDRARFARGEDQPMAEGPLSSSPSRVHSRRVDHTALQIPTAGQGWDLMVCASPGRCCPSCGLVDVRDLGTRDQVCREALRPDGLWSRSSDSTPTECLLSQRSCSMSRCSVPHWDSGDATAAGFLASHWGSVR